MNEIYSSGNYLLISISGGPTYEIAKNLADYKKKDGDPQLFQIRERGIVQVTITKADVDAGLWLDDMATPYTFNTLETFLRSNTANFSTVPGGSGAEIGYVPVWDGSKYVLLPIDSSNIGNSDLTISEPGLRKLILPGPLNSDAFGIRNSADTEDLLKVDPVNGVTAKNAITIGNSNEPTIIFDSLIGVGTSGRISGYNTQLDFQPTTVAIFWGGGSRAFQSNVDGLFMYDGKDIRFDNTTGTKIGTNSSQKFAFWNSTPIAQPVLATGTGATVDDVITTLQNLGLCKQS